MENNRRKYSKEERQKILEKTGCKCGHCGMTLETFSMTVDHVFPLGKGGEDVEYNTLALCKKCNFEKGSWIYKFDEYYKHILPEYFDKFMEYNLRVASKIKNGRMVVYDSMIYNLIPYKHKEIIVNMIKRGAKKDKINKTIEGLQVKVVMNRAYEGDADEIMELLKRYNSKKNFKVFNTSMYTNEYSLINDIKYGEAYVLRLNKELCGVLIYKRIKPEDISLMQLDLIESETILRKKYIMTLLCISDIAMEILPDIMTDMCNTMLQNNIIPLYFNILEEIYLIKEDVISIPYTLEDVTGKLEFLHLKAIRDRYRKSVERIFESDEEDERVINDKIESLVDALLSGGKIEDALYDDLRKIVEKH